jgi:hypothetical protein
MEKKILKETFKKKNLYKNNFDKKERKKQKKFLQRKIISLNFSTCMKKALNMAENVICPLETSLPPYQKSNAQGKAAENTKAKSRQCFTEGENALLLLPLLLIFLSVLFFTRL